MKSSGFNLQHFCVSAVEYFYGCSVVKQRKARFKVRTGEAHLRPVNGVVVLGAPLSVGVVHQGQVSHGRAPLGGGLLLGVPPQQAHRHVGCVVVLKGDLLDLEETQ